MQDRIELKGTRPNGSGILTLTSSYDGRVIVSVDGEAISVSRADLAWRLDDLAPEPIDYEAHAVDESIERHRDEARIEGRA